MRNLQTSLANNSKMLRIKNAKFSGYYFYINTNIEVDFQICISIPLSFKWCSQNGFLSQSACLQPHLYVKVHVPRTHISIRK